MLRRHCADEGRDYDAIEKTVLLGHQVLQDVDRSPAQVGALAILAVTEVQIMPDRHPTAFINEIADKVLPRMASIS